MSKWIPYILTVLLVSMCFLYCRQNSATREIEHHARSLKDSNEIILAYQRSIIHENDSLQSQIFINDLEFNQLIDSLNKIIAGNSVKLKAADQKLKDLIRQIGTIAASTSDSALIMKTDSLQSAYNNAADLVLLLQTDGNTRDSIYVSQLMFKDSVIEAKDRIIAGLTKNFDGSQKIIDQLQSELTKALKTRKRANILRTAAEVAGALLLIFSLKK